MQTWPTIVFESSSSFQKPWLPINWEPKIVAVSLTHTESQIGCIRLVKRLSAGVMLLTWKNVQQIAEVQELDALKERTLQRSGTQRAQSQAGALRPECMSVHVRWLQLYLLLTVDSSNISGCLNWSEKNILKQKKVYEKRFFSSSYFVKDHTLCIKADSVQMFLKKKKILNHVLIFFYITQKTFMFSVYIYLTKKTI